MATTTRTLLRDFALANRLYGGARVHVYRADANGARTSTLATLYAGRTGAEVLDNPVELDNEGKNPAPIYFDVDVICVVDGLSVGTHETGLIKPNVDSTDVDNALSLFRQAIYLARNVEKLTGAARRAATAAAAASSSATIALNQVRFALQQTARGYLRRGANLLDLPDVATARSNLGLPYTVFKARINDGLILSNNAADATNDIDITAGSAFNSTGTRLITLAAGVTRQLDVAFGTGNGGLSSSLAKTLSTTYHAFAVVTAAGAASIGFDTSVVAANLITDHGILAWVRIGSVKTDAANVVRPFDQKGKTFWLKSPVNNDVNTLVLDTTKTLYALAGVPDGIAVEAIILYSASLAAAYGSVYVSCPDHTDVAAASAAPIIAVNAGVEGRSVTEGRILTNTSRQIAGKSSAASTTFTVHTRGWVDVDLRRP